MRVVAVHADSAHRFSKIPTDSIELVEGLGVKGDAHFGATVQHLSRIKADPTQPNLRQVHLIQRELFDWLETRGFSVAPGDLGENITTTGMDLLSLPRGTQLHIGAETVVELTGLRNPCVQINDFQPGLLKELVSKDDGGNLVRRGGVMSVVLTGGTIRAGEEIAVVLPPEPHEDMDRV